MNPDTITQLVDALTVIGTQLTIIAGAIGILGSAVASKAPKHWLITQLCARYFADPRNLRLIACILHADDQRATRHRRLHV